MSMQTTEDAAAFAAATAAAVVASAVAADAGSVYSSII
jgi:hypothetical protein